MTRSEDQNPTPIASACRSFADRAALDAIEVVDASDAINAILRNVDPGGGLDGKAKAAIIEAVRAGKHAELRVRATTFRQKDGHPNKNYLRFKSSALASIAGTFVGRPFLVDHNKWSQSARKGTILASEAAPLAGGWTGFRQSLHVVKPDAVISVLDGTIDAFSIGWDPRGTVVCTAHGVDVRSRKSCYWTEGCYPGKLVDVDGEKRIAEYEWQSTEGLEVSGVNTPAVSGTKIENVAALAAELGLTAAHHEPARKDPTVKLPLLLAALAALNPKAKINPSAELADDADARLADIVTELGAELAAERADKATALERATAAEAKATELAAALAAADDDKIGAVLAAAYKGGKLIRGRDADGKATASPREARLRKIGKVDGLAALQAELDEMPVVVPVDRAELEEDDPNPRPSNGPIPSSVLASTAAQLGIDPEELQNHATHLTGRARGDN